jgi:hypothetical protein
MGASLISKRPHRNGVIRGISAARIGDRRSMDTTTSRRRRTTTLRRAGWLGVVEHDRALLFAGPECGRSRGDRRGPRYDDTGSTNSRHGLRDHPAGRRAHHRHLGQHGLEFRRAARLTLACIGRSRPRRSSSVSSTPPVLAGPAASAVRACMKVGLTYFSGTTATPRSPLSLPPPSHRLIRRSTISRQTAARRSCWA